MKKNTGLAIHLHHNILLEYCYDYNERVQVIKDIKPINQQEIRLRLFKMLSKKAIKELPGVVIKASINLGEINEDRIKAHTEWNEAFDEWNGAFDKKDKEFTKWVEVQSKWNKMNTVRERVNTKFEKAYTKWKNVYNEWDDKEEWHKRHCGCKEWNGKEIVFDTNK